MAIGNKPVPSVTAAQMARIDGLMTRRYGISLLQMMELAGRNLADTVREMLGGSAAGRRVVVLCGPGNNGGGGMVAARHLHSWGARVEVILMGTETGLKPVPARQWKTLRRLGVDILSGRNLPHDQTELILDAIFGYGFHGGPRGRAARWIEWANAQTCPILALDVPSGLEATTGDASTPCIRATATLTLALPKTGLRPSKAAVFVGEILLADIGVPPVAWRSLGLDVGHVFDEGPIVRLSELEHD